MFFNNKDKEKYWVIFLDKEFNMYKFKKKKRIKPNTQIVYYSKKEPYPINTKVPSYRKGLNIYFYIEIGKGQISIQEHDGHIITKEYVDSILTGKFFEQVSKNPTGSSLTGTLTYLIGGAIIGGIIGFMIAGYI